jgi:hypothetical protein
MFACHKSPQGREEACAGWLAVTGTGHLGIRLAVAFGDLPAAALSPGDGWPDLYEDYDQMAAVMAAGQETDASDRDDPGCDHEGIECTEPGCQCRCQDCAGDRADPPGT